MRGSNGTSLPRAASTVSAPIDERRLRARLDANSACSASAVETCVPLRSARPSLAPSASGSMPAARSASAPAGALAVDDELALADQRQREMRERREVARGADRALRRHERDEAGVEEREQRVDRPPARTPE